MGHDPRETSAPLVDAWHRARARRMRPLQVPGHKSRFADGRDDLGSDDLPSDVFGSDLLGNLVRDDLPMQGGADDNAYTGGYLEQGEALWASAVGGDHARFLVGGSTQGNITSLIAAGGPERRVAVDRTSHRSALAGLVISGSDPVWVFPEIHPEFGLPLGVRPESLAGLSDDVVALFVTSPTYVGTISDVRGLARQCHDDDRTLIVDQAWGAHLGFMAGCGAIEQGADIVTTSVHKALMGYSQTAVVTVRGDRINATRLDRAVDLTATTSPSATLMASIDAARAVMDRHGEDALASVIESTSRMRAALRRVHGLVVVDEGELGQACDPLKLTLWLPRTGVNGVALADVLWEQGNGVEVADVDSIVMTISLLDEPEFCEETSAMLVALLERLRGEPRPPAPAALWQVVPEVVMTPRAAYFAPRRRIPLADAVGEVSAEQFCPYPPGVPLLAPGERITEEVVRDIAEAGRIGRVAYCSDPTLESVGVVDA